MAQSSLSAGYSVRTLEAVKQSIEDLLVANNPDINLSPTTPLGILNGIFSLMIVEKEEIMAKIWGSLNIKTQTGLELDTMGVLQREKGSFSTIQVKITYNKSDNYQLTGLDTNAESIEGGGNEFVLLDTLGRQWVLLNTTTLINGDNILEFRAREKGTIVAGINTITKSQMIILGITAITNDASNIITGSVAESDNSYRTRLQRTPISGTFKDLYTTIEAVLNVTDLYIQDNPNDVITNNINPGSIWIIVEGGADIDIGTAINVSKSPGIPTQGAIEVLIANPPASLMPYKFDRPITSLVYVNLTLRKLNASVDFTQNEAGLKAYIVANAPLLLNDTADTGLVLNTTFNFLTDKNFLSSVRAVDCQLSLDNINFVNVIKPPTFQHKLKFEVANIVIIYTV